MPKLLSRSKHEEFESNLALQIRYHKERRAENARKVELQEFLHIEKLLLPATIHPTTVHISALFYCYFTLLLFLFQFFVSSHFVLVIAFSFRFFWVISYTLSTYISLSLYKQSLHLGNTESGRQFPRCFLFSIFFNFLSSFLVAKHPPRMTTWRMSC